MKPHPKVSIVLGAALFMGCPPPSYGIFRSASIAEVPDLACVRDLLGRNGAKPIEFYDHEGGQRITWRGLAAPSHSPSFLYTASDVRYALQFHIDPGHSIAFRHVGFAEREASASTLRSIRAHLEAVDRALQDQCDVRELLVGLKEECRGENCVNA